MIGGLYQLALFLSVTSLTINAAPLTTYSSQYSNNDGQASQSISERYQNSTLSDHTAPIYGIGGSILYSQYPEEDDEDVDDEDDEEEDEDYGMAAYGSNSTFNSTDMIMNKSKKKAKKNYAVVEILNRMNNYYTAELEIGSNKDKVQVQVDTGSTDLWVTNSSICSGDVKQWCDSLGTFNAAKSKTLKNKKKKFVDGYGDGKSSTNTWVTDNLYLGGAMEFKNFYFGVSNKVKNAWYPGSQGILGLSFYNAKKSITTKFKKAAHAKKLGFGVYLGEPNDGAKGSIVFGGIDWAKVDGDLTAIQTVGHDLKYKKQTSWSFISQGMGWGKTRFSDEKASVLLDTGCTNIGVPPKVFDKLVSKLNAKEKDGQYLFNCPKTFEDIVFYFENDVAIKVPSKSLMMINGGDCALRGIVSQGTNSYQLGDYFLRYAYVYFDVNKKTALIGQVKHTTDTNIQAYTKDVKVNHKKPSANVVKRP